jgi:hypothetical protein
MNKTKKREREREKNERRIKEEECKLNLICFVMCWRKKRVKEVDKKEEKTQPEITEVLFLHSFLFSRANRCKMLNFFPKQYTKGTRSFVTH